MLGPDEAGFVGPVLHHAPRMGCGHPLEDGAVVVAEPGEERKEVAPGEDIDGIDLDKLEPGKGPAHRP